LALGIAISWKLEQRIHNNGLLGEGKIDDFYLDISRIIGNFHFSIVPVGTLEVNVSSYRRGKFLFGGVGKSDSTV